MSIMGGKRQRRYWLANRCDALRGWVRATFAPGTMCKNEHLFAPNGTLVLVCDKRRLHRGGHCDRRFLGRKR